MCRHCLSRLLECFKVAGARRRLAAIRTDHVMTVHRELDMT